MLTYISLTENIMEVLLTIVGSKDLNVDLKLGLFHFKEIFKNT